MIRIVKLAWLKVIACLVAIGFLTQGSTCATDQNQVPDQIIRDVANAVVALSSSFNAAVQKNPSAISSWAQTRVNDNLAVANSLVGNLSPSTPAGAAALDVRKIEQALNAVVMIAASLAVIPPPFSIAIGALVVVLPIIEAWVNSVVPAPAALSPEASAVRARLEPPGMTEQEAEGVLASFARYSVHHN